MLVSEITENTLTPELIDRLLFQKIEDTGENADCILVLGSLKAAKYRVPVAARAYKAGRSGKMMLCGGKLRDFPDGKCSEAEHMRQAALALGVAEEDVILENRSQSTVENILFARAELQQAFGLNDLHRVLLVTTTYHMRCSLALARHLLPEQITVIPCPANDNNTRRDNWRNTPEGSKRATDEAGKIVQYVRNGVIPDFEV